MGKKHKLYPFFKEMYSSLNTEGKKYKNFKHSVDLDTTLSGGIAGKVWFDEYVVLENETYPSPIRYVCPDIRNNHVLSVHYHDPVYDTEYVFRTNILEGAKFPEATLRPEDFEQQRGYRPNLGFNNNNRYDYRQNRNSNVANRMLQNSLGSSGGGGEGGDLPSLMSSAHGGIDSVYGSYKSSSTFVSHSGNNSSYQQYRQQGSYNYNSGGARDGNGNGNANYNRNNNSNNNRNYNNYNSAGNAGNGGNGGNYGNSNQRSYNYNNNNNQGYNNSNRNSNYNYNNNQAGGTSGGQGQRSNQHTRFQDDGQGQAQGQGQGQGNVNSSNSGNQQQRQYNRQNTR